MRASSRLALATSLLTVTAAAADLDVTYSVRVENLSAAAVLFKLDDAKPCTAESHGSCTWDIVYGSHHIDAYVGDKHYGRDFELSDESDVQVRCNFDATGFVGNSC